MKMMKALVRSDRAEDVVRSLEAAGAPGITVDRVHTIGYGNDPCHFTLAPSEVAGAPEMVRIETVCRDEAVPALLAAIVTAAHTGLPGDGMVFVSAVERAVKVANGAEYPEALAPEPDAT